VARQTDNQLRELLEAYSNRLLTDVQFDELAERIAVDPDACREYLQAANLNLLLKEHAQRSGEQTKSEDIVRRVELLASGQTVEGVSRPQNSGARSWGSLSAFVLFATAAVVLVVLQQFSFFGPTNQQIATPNGQAASPGETQAPNPPELDTPESNRSESNRSGPVKPPGQIVTTDANRADGSLERLQYVAQLVDVSQDVVWDGQSEPQDLFLRLKPGSPLTVKRGSLKVAFGEGATVILSGPASLTPLSPRAARLAYGRLHGRAENGNFELSTPTAEVIDYGTEFGVRTSPELGTEVCVFDGEVGVAVGAEHKTGQAELRLNRGMAVRIKQDGTIAKQTNIDRGAFAGPGDAFQSNLLPRNQLSLMSVLANAPRGENPVAIAIDPRDGNWDPRIPRDDRGRYRPGDGKYHLSNTSAAVDGVFIPHPSGAGVQINSALETFDFGKNQGVTWGPIWGRRRVAGLPATSLFRGVIDEYWGKDTRSTIAQCVNSSRLGVIGLHANVGVTIDLRAISMQHDLVPSQLTARLANLDNSESSRYGPHPKWDIRSADVRIIVDGEVRFERLNLQRVDGEVQLLASLRETDRFLTVVVTDAGNSNWFDHIVLIDGVLHLGID